MPRKSFITVGHACWDIIYHVHQLPPQNHKCVAQQVTTTAGGSAPRTALALSRQADVAMISVLGHAHSALTQALVNQLAAGGVDLQHCVQLMVEPAHSSIWLDSEGARTIVSCHTPDHALPSDVRLPRAQVALFDNNKPLLNRSVRQKLNSDCVTLLDVDSECSNSSHLQGYDQVWFSEQTLERVGISLRDLSTLWKCVVGVTQGSKPVIWCESNEIRSVQPPRVTVSNSCGAGDLWRAHLAWALGNNVDLTAAVTSACDRTCEQLNADSTIS